METSAEEALVAKVQFTNPPDVHRALKLLSVVDGRPLISLIRDAVAEYVARRSSETSLLSSAHSTLTPSDLLPR